MHVLCAERFNSYRCHECRVDAARQTDHDVGEAVLAHVIACAEGEGGEHLVEFTERLGDARRGCATG